MLYQGVTLGMTGHHGGKRHPTLGNNVMVGANATILGDIHLGDNVKVGAGAVVVKDVPANVTVAGVPATIVKEHRCWEAARLTLVKPEDLDNENVRWSCAL
jgi:serine O-acetyltransferase